MQNSCRLTQELVGAPFVVSLPRSIATYANLTRTIEGYARHSVDIFQPPVQRLGSGDLADPQQEDDEMEVLKPVKKMPQLKPVKIVSVCGNCRVI